MSVVRPPAEERGRSAVTHTAFPRGPSEMTAEAPSCYRCQGAMAAGMLIDRDYATKHQARWAAGEPRSGFGAWLGGEVSGKRDQYRVVTYRCTRCGALESFAKEPG